MKIVYTLGMLVSFIVFAHGQWISTDGPKTDFEAYDLHLINDALTIRTHCGYFLDQGEDWKDVELPSFEISLQVDSFLFVAETAKGLNRINLNSSINDLTEMPVNSIFEIKVHGDRIYACSWTDGLVVSDDYGESWQGFNNDIPIFYWNSFGDSLAYQHILNIEFSEEYVFVENYFGIYRSDYSLQNWELLISGENLQDGEIEDVTPILLGIFENELYYALEDRLYKIDENGADAIFLYKFPTYVNSLEEHEGVFIVNTEKDLWTSVNLGMTWELVSIDMNGGGKLYKIGSDLYYLNDQGIFAFQENLWRNFNKNIVCTSTRQLIKNQFGLSLIANSAIFTLTNEKTWLKLGDHLEGGNIFWLTKSNDGLVQTRIEQVGNYVYSSYYTWNTSEEKWEDLNFVNSPYEKVTEPIRIQFFNNTIILHRPKSFMYSNTLGATWESNEASGSFDLSHGLLEFKGSLYCARQYTSDLLQTQLDGSYNFLVTGISENETITRMMRTENYILAMTSSSGIYYSDLQLNNDWKQFEVNDIDNFQATDYAFKGDVLFLSDMNSIYYTKNLGASWDSISIDNLKWGAYEIEVVGDSLYAGSDEGIWVYDISDIKAELPSHVDDEITSLLEIVLFPNPTSGNLYLGVGDLSLQKLEVVNAFGQVLMNQQFEKGTVINTSFLDEGMYWIKLYSQNESLVLPFLVTH